MDVKGKSKFFTGWFFFPVSVTFISGISPEELHEKCNDPWTLRTFPHPRDRYRKIIPNAGQCVANEILWLTIHSTTNINVLKVLSKNFSCSSNPSPHLHYCEPFLHIFPTIKFNTYLVKPAQSSVPPRSRFTPADIPMHIVPFKPPYLSFAIQGLSQNRL